MPGPSRFRFLNREREVTFPEGWNDPQVDKLWLYNLHYFEDLVSEGAATRTAWHRALIDRWVADNRPGAGNGWEPYPLSIRIVNIVKWILKGNTPEPRWLRSLAVQVSWLSRRMEWHLLGNHLFENAKALVMAGMFFQGQQADKWRRDGLSILEQQLEEQVLEDGAHFERSPMYHALVLEGILDLIRVSGHYGMHREHQAHWRSIAADMLAWMRGMTHPDGQIALFNDAALDVALSPRQLDDYADALGIDMHDGRAAQNGTTYLEASGYLGFTRGPMVVIMDAAPLGPDYLPGHGHADTLSFEMSVHGSRVLVNSGTGIYGTSSERLAQRGTAAHNTVVVNGENSSEVWSGFRVARRAKPFDVTVRGHGETWSVAASHDGYRRLPGRVTHRRTWSISQSGLVVRDKLYGRCNEAVAYFHFHPAAEVELNGSEGVVLLRREKICTFSVPEGGAELGTSTYHPEFGLTQKNPCLQVRLVNGACRVAFDIAAEQ